MNNLRQALLLFLLMTTFLSTTEGQNSTAPVNPENSQGTSKSIQSAEKKFKVTFIELGSVRCIPCLRMQPVMKSIEAKYGKEVKVTFHDVWTDAGKPFGVKYGIEAIPTQIFLDETGKEFYRHIGYFPEEELVKVLKQKGIKPI
jgi:thioredoxin 1